MAASYPGAIKSFSANVDGVTEVTAATVNSAYDEITAIETELGADVAGSVTNLVTRLAKSLSGAGLTSYADPTELTISSGSITSTANFHYVDTQGDAASDDLDTIVAPGAGENPLLFLRIAADARNVVIKHNTGNIYCAGGKDITLDLVSDLAVLIYDNAQDKWMATAQQVYLGGSNTYTGLNYFNGGMATKVTAITGNLTLDSTHNVIDANATSGNITVTLPAVATYANIRYTICKNDASANTVTIDGNAAETINGAATKVLSNQYDTATIVAGASEWRVIA